MSPTMGAFEYASIVGKNEGSPSESCGTTRCAVTRAQPALPTASRAARSSRERTRTLFMTGPRYAVYRGRDHTVPSRPGIDNPSVTETQDDEAAGAQLVALLGRDGRARR